MSEINQKPGRGGKRPNAGRKVSSVTKKTRDVANREIDSGKITPLEFMLHVMRNDPDPDKQLDAAKSAAPYIHAKLAAITHKGDSEHPIEAVIRLLTPEMMRLKVRGQ